MKKSAALQLHSRLENIFQPHRQKTAQLGKLFIIRGIFIIKANYGKCWKCFNLIREKNYTSRTKPSVHVSCHEKCENGTKNNTFIIICERVQKNEHKTEMKNFTHDWKLDTYKILLTKTQAAPTLDGWSASNSNESPTHISLCQNVKRRILPSNGYKWVIKCAFITYQSDNKFAFHRTQISFCFDNWTPLSLDSARKPELLPNWIKSNNKKICKVSKFGMIFCIYTITWFVSKS